MGKKKITPRSVNNRRRAGKKNSKKPVILNKNVKKAWDGSKTVEKNMESMGLASDPNKLFPVQTLKDMLVPKIHKKETEKVNKITKPEVMEKIEKQAAIPVESKHKLSEDIVQFCVFMIERYGDDYKKMSRDRKNYWMRFL